MEKLKIIMAALLILFIYSSCSSGGVTVSLSPQQEAARELKLISLLTEATQLLRRGTAQSIDQAFAALELARDLKADDPRVYDGLGCVEYRRNNYQLAEYFFKKALEYDGSYDRAYAHLALVAEQRGNKSAARILLRKAVKLNPMNYRARNNYAVIILEGGDVRRAQHELQKAAQSGGDEEAVVYYNLLRTK